jgi:hypothetical protein
LTLFCPIITQPHAVKSIRAVAKLKEGVELFSPMGTDHVVGEDQHGPEIAPENVFPLQKNALIS